jgi:hypothetical protein
LRARWRSFARKPIFPARNPDNLVRKANVLAPRAFRFACKAASCACNEIPPALAAFRLARKAGQAAAGPFRLAREAKGLAPKARRLARKAKGLAILGGRRASLGHRVTPGKAARKGA